jgi:xanthine/CO dehydrogenase XdhC/CoxF family maturation factor
LEEPQRAALAATREAIEAERPVALATLLDGPGAGAKMVVTGEGTVGSLGVADLLDRSVEREARGFLGREVGCEPRLAGHRSDRLAPPRPRMDEERGDEHRGMEAGLADERPERGRAPQPAQPHGQ